MDWIHCNKCYIQPGAPKNIKFVVTNCGHLYCAHCQSSLKECIICQRECTTIPIEQGMSKDMELYFLPPDKNIRKQFDVLEFQQSHRLRLMKFMREKTSKFDAMKDECKRHAEEKNKLKDELIGKCEEIRLLKKQLKEALQINSQHSGSSTKPMSQANSAQNFEAFFNKGGRVFGSQSQAFNTPLRSNSFFKGSASPISGKENMFTPPPPVSFQDAYRNCNSMATSPVMTPPSGSSPVSSESRHTGPIQRKMYLPGDKGSSPINRIGLQRLNLKTTTPTLSRSMQSPMVKISSRQTRPLSSAPFSTNKYNKYF